MEDWTTPSGPPAHEFPNPTPALGLVLLTLGLLTGSAFVWAPLSALSNSRFAYYPLIALLQLVMLGLPAMLYARTHATVRLAIRRRRLPLWAYLPLALAAVLAMLIAAYGSAAWVALLRELGIDPPPSSVPIPQSMTEALLSMVVVGMIPALCEEYLFRGVVLHSLEQIGTRRAIVLSGLLFSLLHGSIAGLPVHLMLGFLLGWLMVHYGTLTAPMVFHGVYNSAAMLFSYVITALKPESDAAVVTPTFVEALRGLLPLLLVLGCLSYALLRGPLRSLSRTQPPILYPQQERLPRAARWIAVLVFALYGLLYLGAVLGSQT